MDAKTVWVVLWSYYDDVRVEDVFISREQALEEYPPVDVNGMPTGYEIIESTLV